jgi:guanine deaminase
VLIRPTAGSTLEAVLRHSDSPERTLGALFALAREESVAEVRVAGDPVSSPAGQTPPGGAGT